MKTEKMLMFLKIFSWFVFFGYLITAGSLLISFVLSFFNPEIASKMYNVDSNIFILKEKSTFVFVCAFSLIVVMACMISYFWFLVIKLFDKLNLKNPFSMEIAKHLEKMAYYLFGIFIVSVIANGFLEWNFKYFIRVGFRAGHSNFLFMAGIIYIISQIFKRGIEIQQENELTV